MSGYRKLLAFLATSGLIFTLSLMGKDSGSGVDAIVWAFGVFVAGNSVVNVGTKYKLTTNGGQWTASGGQNGQ